jgi:hypothetical protein
MHQTRCSLVLWHWPAVLMNDGLARRWLADSEAVACGSARAWSHAYLSTCARVTRPWIDLQWLLTGYAKFAMSGHHSTARARVELHPGTGRYDACRASMRLPEGLAAHPSPAFALTCDVPAPAAFDRQPAAASLEAEDRRQQAECRPAKNRTEQHA